MSNFASSNSVILLGVRATWLDIFKPGEGMNGGAAKFKVSALIEPDSENSSVAKAAMLDAAKKLWGDNAVGVIKSMAANNKALRNGNDKLNDDGSVRLEYAAMLYISASNKMKPQVVGPKKHNGQFVTITEAARGTVQGLDVTEQLGWEVKAPYRGCYINLKVQFVAGKSFKGGNGEIIPNQVYAKVEAVQFVRDGEAFGAGPTSAEGFGEEEVAEGAAGGNDLF
jgi:hypothetical protein